MLQGWFVVCGLYNIQYYTYVLHIGPLARCPLAGGWWWLCTDSSCLMFDNNRRNKKEGRST